MAEGAWLSWLGQQALLLSAAVLLLALARPLLKRQGAGLVYAAWLLVPALLLTPLLPRPAPQQEPLPLVLGAAGLDAHATLPTWSRPAPDQGSLWLMFWLMLWLAGAALSLALQLRHQWRLQRHGSRLPAGHSPALIGLLRPRVQLPLDFEARFGATERALILAHEDVHRSRHDNLWNLLAGLLVALHWWNPLAHWAWRRMQTDQELSCDAAVLASRPGDRPVYARALLLAHGLDARAAPLASRWSSHHPLIERIAMLNRPRSATSRGRNVLAASLLALTGLVYAAQAADVPAPREYQAVTVDLQWQDAAGRTQGHWPVTLPWHFFVTNQPFVFSPPSTAQPLEVVLRGSQLPDGRRQLTAAVRDRKTQDTLSAEQALAEGAAASAEVAAPAQAGSGRLVFKFLQP
ncbi:beta-lactamase regulating signal transducer with metallopeptidase domain [Pelomonas saccharophila]|uniref:Beta-lactamase regulating signal transducer with metallopeptidase domain n=1 Tax=Roseateles saccharophilus TaxID=304 RepID=A0ABU1YIB4_ROSSA|nr:M56 family metallopeptidase [Roseateles saccharophilus]MDR7268585.1 beta-lactamase regulating signal transducer with metallopeptidase domain [Roseateles saccharophilus]